MNKIDNETGTGGNGSGGSGGSGGASGPSLWLVLAVLGGIVLLAFAFA